MFVKAHLLEQFEQSTRDVLDQMTTPIIITREGKNCAPRFQNKAAKELFNFCPADEEESTSEMIYEAKVVNKKKLKG